MYCWREAAWVQNKHRGRTSRSEHSLMKRCICWRRGLREGVKCFYMAPGQKRCVLWCFSRASGMFLEARFQRAALQLDSVSVFCLESLLVFLNETDGRRRADIFIKDSLCFAMDVEVFGIKTITYLSICSLCSLSLSVCLSPPLSLSLSLSLSLPLSLSGVQLVRECQEAAEEYGEAARPELGAQDQAVQQICPGQRWEAERQQRRQLLRRYGSFSSLRVKEVRVVKQQQRIHKPPVSQLNYSELCWNCGRSVSWKMLLCCIVGIVVCTTFGARDEK